MKGIANSESLYWLLAHALPVYKNIAKSDTYDLCRFGVSLAFPEKKQLHSETITLEGAFLHQSLLHLNPSNVRSYTRNQPA